jgi:heme-degrading monooxygenase HmoA
MIGVIVTIGPGEDLNRQRATAAAEQAGPMFEGMDGLRSKVFMWDEETGTVTNTYVWDSEAAARAFFTPELKAQVAELWGAEPRVRFTEVSALIDNAVGVA